VVTLQLLLQVDLEEAVVLEVVVHLEVLQEIHHLLLLLKEIKVVLVELMVHLEAIKELAVAVELQQLVKILNHLIWVVMVEQAQQQVF
jgi:hypothetical protein